MTTTQAAPRGLWHTIRNRIVLFGVVLFVVLLTVRLAWGYLEASRFNAAIAAIQAAGEPVTFKELDKDLPRVDEADDAGPYYEAALALIRHKDDTKLWEAWSEYADRARNAPTSRPGDDLRARVDRLLSDNQLALEMLDRGAALPQCHFDIGVERDMDSCFERLSRIRAAAKLLWLRAIVRAEKGEGDPAVDSAIALLRLTRTCDRRPILIVYLVRIACTSLATSETGSLLALARPSGPALLRLAAAYRNSQSVPVKDALLAERVYSLRLMRDLIDNGQLGAQDNKVTLPASWMNGRWEMRPFLQRMAVAGLADLAHAIRIAEQPPLEALKAMKAIASTQSDPTHLMALPMERVFLHSALLTAQIRSTDLAISIERFRRTNAKLPDTLAQLVPQFVPALPADPLSGKDLIYRHDATGFSVYSVGENGIDDGGRLTPGKDEHGLPDAGVRVPFLHKETTAASSSAPA